MINTNCEVLIAKTLDEALQLLSDRKENFKIIAGGTDIVTGIKQESRRFSDIQLLIDINKIDAIKGITKVEDKIIIGASTTFSELCSNEIITKELPILKKAASTIGSLQIRNKATIAGNFVNNAPCADIVPALIVYDASLVIESLSGKREILLKKFLLEPYKTQLKKGEIVTKIILPISSENYKGDFYKLGRRRAVAISRLTLAVLINTENEFIHDIRIASGAVTPIGKRFPKLEEFAINKKYDAKLCANLSQRMGKEILDVTGLRWSSAYKLPVVQQMFYQLLMNIGNL